MQSILQKRALNAGATSRPANVKCAVTVRSCKRATLACKARASRRSAVECRAFFSFFTPKPAAPAPIVDPRAKPLVEQLISLTSGTDAGAKASPAAKEEIAAVVTELSRYCIKNPVKSDLLFGEWKVLFSSKPTAVGGPLRSGAGPAVFPGQVPKQILERPNKLINVAEFKTLGFLPGYSRQFGEFEALSGDSYILNITDGEISAGLGGPVKKQFDIKRRFKILYLDDEVRVVLFLPSEDLPDSEVEESGGSRSEDDVVFVFQRIKEGAEEEAEQPSDDGEAPEEQPKPAFFGGGRKLESAATVAERQVRQQIQQRGGSAKISAPPAKAPAQGTSRLALPTPAAKPGSVRGRKQPVEEVEEDPRERRRREQEEERARKAAEAEAKAAEAKAARERAEAERQAERERQAAIKELLAKLSAEIKERQAEAKDALKELKDIEKSAGAGLREVVAARARVDEAEADVKSVSAELDTAAAAKREAEKAAKEAKDVVTAAEKVLRERLAAAAPVLPRK